MYTCELSAKILPRGGALVLRLPSPLVHALGFKAGVAVAMDPDDGSMIIAPKVVELRDDSSTKVDFSPEE